MPMDVRLLIVTDRYPIDAVRSPTAWLPEHLRAIGAVADITVVSLVRLLPRLKNFLYGGYDRRWLRARRAVPDVEYPFPHGTVIHRRCFTLPDAFGWGMNPRLLLWQQRSWLRKLLRGQRFDAVLLHYLHAAAPTARFAARTAGIPLWVDENETLGSMHEEGQDRLRRWILRQLEDADVLIAQCGVQETELKLLLPEKCVHVVALGIGNDAPAVEPAAPPPLRFVCVSRLDLRSKHVDRLLRAVALLRGEDAGAFFLTIAGDGFLRGALQQLARELAIGDHVRFTGWLPPAELRALVGTQHVAVQPSEHESFGLVALEAAAAGLPLIAGARAGVVPDLAAEGAAVLPLRQCTPGGIAQAMREAYERFPELQHQALVARGRIRERYSWRAHAAAYAALFSSLEK